MWIVGLIVALILVIWFEVSNRNDTKRQAMTKEERLEHDIAQLSPEWQKTIQAYREKKNTTNIDC